ncbi:MAG TPA: carboxylating nicotinate-nucleotide diphosphorylase [Symbiobacteriaceae bacterium]|nr:carboxylating nicotinate-nucleotide diphosphorylase [Symbiobacteriaceae bacterium]
MTLNPIAVEEIVRRALLEDIGPGDITTEATIPADKLCTAVIIAKEEGVLCGQPVAQIVFRVMDPSLSYEILVPEGSRVTPGMEVARITGSARSVLTAERVALNFLQRMSGIATITRRLSDAIKYYHARLVETRKTTPGLRIFEKYAVRVGGGLNHRYGLHDAILIKDNHIAVAGGVRQSIIAARKVASHTSRVEVEVDTLEQLQEALDSGADIILLDNMDADTMRRAVEMTAGKAILEASGGITAANLEDVARTGVDIISMGALTHSVKALDLSLDIVL